jgi:hypothetical protein
MTVENATIVLTTSRPWFGNQQLGAFAISLDRKSAGVLMPQGSLELSCTPGDHRIRARQWWYLSPPIGLELAPGETVRLKVDLVRGGFPLRSWLTLVFLPWKGVSINRADG